MKTPVTYLYAIGSWDGPVKFGISLNPWKRSVQIQTASTFRVELLYAQPCNSRQEALTDERWLHQYYTNNGNLLFGEWFNLQGPQAIEAVRDAVNFGNEFRSRARLEGAA